jgi:hypothetical protein
VASLTPGRDAPPPGVILHLAFGRQAKTLSR